MAGHSKFKNIQYRKAAQDKKRARIFSRLAREITVAAKSGLPDPEANARLRTAIMAARAQNMPKDNITRAIHKAADTDGTKYEAIRYEGFAPGGVGVIVEALTDNRNRTASELRAIFTRQDGNLGETGSVAFLFDHVGVVVCARTIGDEATVMEAAIAAGAQDVAIIGESYDIICDSAALHDVARALEDSLGPLQSAGLEWRPQSDVAITDRDEAAKVLKLMDALDDCDDVQNVYANFDIADALLEALAP